MQSLLRNYRLRLSLDLKAHEHYSCSGLFDEPVTDELALVLTGASWNIQESELYYLSLHRYASLAVELSFEAKSGLESTKVVAALVFPLDL
jgi:hypothetical protein